MRINYLLLAGLACTLAAQAVAQDNRPPTVEIISWEKSENIGNDPVFGPFAPFRAIDPNTENFLEADLVRLTLLIKDADWICDPDDDQQSTEQGEEVFVRFAACPLLAYPGYSSPPAPPVAEADTRFFGADGFEPEVGFAPPRCVEEYVLPLTFQIPPFNGKNQARLRGLIDFDIRYFILIEVANDADPDTGDNVDGPLFACSSGAFDVGRDSQTINAVESSRFAPPNPPPFADAGGDETVEVGTIVVLDASRTFDGFNVGFDPRDGNVFEKDTIIYTWEWLSGPQAVEPVQSAPTDPTATVELNTVGEYVFRVTANDQVNATSTTANVTITVVEELPQNGPPLAVISGPTGTIRVGDVITLDASGSLDPDGDALGYRWLQVNELGGRLEQDELTRVFQPLSGLDQAKSTWQAVSAGTFYFRLLVSDGQAQDDAFTSLTVVPQGTAGESVTSGGTNDAAVGANDGVENLPLGVPACGGSLLPLAMVPFALLLMRRR